MAMAPVDFTGAVPIDGYGPGFFRVGGKVWHGALLVHEGGITPWGGLADTAALAVLAGRADLLLLGTGAEIAHPPPALVDAAAALGLRVEAMASPAAARSYNVLLSEGRRLAVALVPV